ncbi:MAG: molybdopterin-guanine dinucleotide biosynthesis protein B [Deltaproteobacteria bacterium]|nr:MAG: molybdopterin-guanine dinucleotide biosynthesis protein B [Deltaproteobacteria bacterium]
MVAKSPPILLLAGYSSSGKTTLLEQILAGLTARGYRVATVKHTSKAVRMDEEGKDSWRHREAGAVATFLVAANGVAAYMEKDESTGPGTLVKLCPEGTDLLLVEGFKGITGHPRIEVFGEGVEIAAPGPETILRVTANPGLTDHGEGIYSRDEVDGVVEAIAEKLLGG